MLAGRYSPYVVGALIELFLVQGLQSDLLPTAAIQITLRFRGLGIIYGRLLGEVGEFQRYSAHVGALSRLINPRPRKHACHVTNMAGSRLFKTRTL